MSTANKEAAHDGVNTPGTTSIGLLLVHLRIRISAFKESVRIVVRFSCDRVHALGPAQERLASLIIRFEGVRNIYS